MNEQETGSAVLPAATKPRPARMWNVILLDDDDHTYEYVIEMLMKLFHHSRADSLRMAEEVDQAARVVVDTTGRERAELKCDQIQGYGADWRIERCAGSMSAEIEPVA